MSKCSFLYYQCINELAVSSLNLICRYLRNKYMNSCRETG